MTRVTWVRLVVAGLCLAVLAVGGALAAVSVGGSSRHVSMLGPWTDSDERSLRKALEVFERRTGITVDYQGTTAESAVLRAEVETGTQPDVAVLPTPAELASYQKEGALTRLDDLVGSEEDDTVPMPRARIKGRPGVYWVPVKVDLKSIVWFDRRHPGDTHWCAGMGDDATSGWPGTDWVEDILLQRSGPDVYKDWATGRLSWRSAPVTAAWRTWGRLFHSGKVRRRALLTSAKDAWKGLRGAAPTCTLEHAAANFDRVRYAPNHLDRDYRPSSEVIPGVVSPQSWEISGDLAGMFRDTPEAQKLIGFLSSPAFQRSWGGKPPLLSPDREVLAKAYAGDGPATRIAADLAGNGTHCFDASDAMPSAMRDAFQDATLRFLASPGSLTSILEDLDETERSVRKLPWMSQVCG
jgi:alpha-glucoside transport system substrate-binding protein